MSKQVLTVQSFVRNNTSSPSRPPFAILRSFVRLNHNRSGALLLVRSSASSRLLRTTTVAVQRSGTVGLALRGLIALFTNEFVDAEVDNALMGTDCVFSDVHPLRWHGMELIGCVITMLPRKGTELIRDGSQPAICPKHDFAAKSCSIA